MDTALAAVHREIAHRRRAQGLRVASRGTLARRAARLDPLVTTTARQGPEAARALQAAGSGE